MKQLNIYIVEKLHLDKDIRVEKTREEVDALNKEIKMNALSDIEDFLAHEIGVEGEDYELKFPQSPPNEIRIYLYNGGKDYFKEVEDIFYKKGYGKKDWFTDLIITNYGIKIRVSFILHSSDFDNKVFKHRK